ncbi:MAG: SIS domain-containing protein [Desulfamplus sp.]|nr:SIS domain-containing protein [Desulfamplus sp.]
MDFFNAYLNTLGNLIKKIDLALFQDIIKLLDSLTECGKVIIVGNGGSAAIASHIAIDLTKSAHIRAVNFNETSLITCLSNDYGYENWVAKGLEYYSDPDDVVILISSSGQSPNIINGAEAAKKLGLKIITLSGFDADNPLRGKGDVNLWVDSNIYNFVETTHQAWLASIVDNLCGSINVK